VNLFLSPHNDDETLFGAFTIQRVKPLVAVVFDSYVQAQRGNVVTWRQRRNETQNALAELGVGDDVRFLGMRDDVFTTNELTGHAHHDVVALVADCIWPGRVTHYLTYTRTGGKSISANRVPVESGEWVRRKLRALACYESQIDIERLGCREHFLRDLHEYYA
jgi:LmbE family N-acetylglucosaminyl deacetylase